MSEAKVVAKARLSRLNRAIRGFPKTPPFLGRFLGVFGALFYVLSARAEFSRPVDLSWSHPTAWAWLIEHTVDSFSFDRVTGSCATALARNRSGSGPARFRDPTGLTRSLQGVAQSAYAYAWDGRPASLLRAQASLNFIQRNLLNYDERGPYFLPWVSLVPAAPKLIPQNLLIEDQAMGISAHLALFRRNPSQVLWSEIETMYFSFLARFRDERRGMGLYERYDLKNGRPIGQDEKYSVKGFSSLVNAPLSFLFELFYVSGKIAPPLGDRVNQSVFFLIQELGLIIANQMWDPETGWLRESLDANLKPRWGNQHWQLVKGDRLGVVGNHFRAAWFLLRIVFEQASHIQNERRFMEVARQILRSMLNQGVGRKELPDGTTRFAGILNCVTQGSAQIWNFPEDRGTSQWSRHQGDAILALTLADLTGVLSIEEGEGEAGRIVPQINRGVRDATIRYLFEHFVDEKEGGLFAEIIISGEGPSCEKVSAEKSIYPAIELARFMKRYGQIRGEQNRLGKEKTRVRGRANYEIMPLALDQGGI